MFRANRSRMLGPIGPRDRDFSDYLGLKLDDPSFTAPIFANLFDDEGYSLIWSRPNGCRQRRLMRPQCSARPIRAGHLNLVDHQSVPPVASRRVMGALDLGHNT